MNQEGWKRLWKAVVPNKIKIHGCRIIHDQILCREVLVRKHIGDNSSCPLCPVQHEDILHMQFTCQRAQAVWRAMGLWGKIERVIRGHQTAASAFKALLHSNEKISEMEGVGLKEIVMTGCWYIWWERRQFVNGESIQNHHRAAMAIIALAMNYKRAAKVNARARKGWVPPPEGMLMLNIDASVDSQTNTGSTGAVLRDSKGMCIAASHDYLANVADVHSAETWALKHGLMLAQHVGVTRLMVRTDCVEVAETMQEGGGSATVAAAIYDDCVRLWREFVNISIEHCDREANVVAHTLARQAFRSKSSYMWVDETPDFILGVTANDVTVLYDQ
jgi:ribonuclease HI